VLRLLYPRLNQNKALNTLRLTFCTAVCTILYVSSSRGSDLYLVVWWDGFSIHSYEVRSIPVAYSLPVLVLIEATRYQYQYQNWYHYQLPDIQRALSGYATDTDGPCTEQYHIFLTAHSAVLMCTAKQIDVLSPGEIFLLVTRDNSSVQI
jgi:hypothetical protein